jgi:hypothetical protein
MRDQPINPEILSEFKHLIPYMIDKEWIAQDKYELKLTKLGHIMIMGFLLKIGVAYTHPDYEGEGLPEGIGNDAFTYMCEYGLVDLKKVKGLLCGTPTDEGIKVVLKVIDKDIKKGTIDEFLEIVQEDRLRKIRFTTL